MLTIVAAIAWGKPVFLSHPDRREEANAARKLLAADSAGATYSEKPVKSHTLSGHSETVSVDQSVLHQ